MTEVTEELKSRLSRLSAGERAELTRRMDEIETGKAFGEPADKVFVELREKYS